MIYLWDVGFSFTLLVSGKLKSILEIQKDHGLQFIQCSIFQNGIEYEDYWLLNVFENNNDLIDFINSKISVNEKKVDGGTNKKTVLNITSQQEFDTLIEQHKEKLEVVNIDHPKLKDNITSNFFLLKKPTKYVVSETLKNKIEHQGCTGIEFMPIELSINEWLAEGGEREKMYGKA